MDRIYVKMTDFRAALNYYATSQPVIDLLVKLAEGEALTGKLDIPGFKVYTQEKEDG